jgi:hypothetical protein
MPRPSSGRLSQPTSPLQLLPPPWCSCPAESRQKRTSRSDKGLRVGVSRSSRVKTEPQDQINFFVAWENNRLFHEENRLAILCHLSSKINRRIDILLGHHTATRRNACMHGDNPGVTYPFSGAMWTRLTSLRELCTHRVRHSPRRDPPISCKIARSREVDTSQTTR